MVKKNSNKITKAVFPVAGLGVRFLPATKASPKEMMAIVDKPLIQYAVEEAVAAGITELIFITSNTKRSIEDHFDRNYELERLLQEREQYGLLKEITNTVPDNITCIYIRQTKPLGLGHAVYCAKSVIGNEPFAVLLADDLLTYNNTATCLQQMCEIYTKTDKTLIAVEHVELCDTKHYGIIKIDPDFKDLGVINGIIEKPQPTEAPSQYGAVGRYILRPEIFQYIEKCSPNNNEIQLTDAINALSATQDVFAYCFKGKRFDCGKKLGYLQAIVDFGLKHPEIGEDFRKHIAQVMNKV